MNTYQIRPATPQDLEAVLDHRRRMFEDMGFTDQQALDAMLASSTPLLRRGLSQSPLTVDTTSRPKIRT